MAAVAMRSRRAAASNPEAQLTSSPDVDVLLGEPMFVDRLRVHDCPPVTDGGAAIVLAAGDVARELCERPAWIRGIDHRIEPHGLGLPRPDPLGVHRAGRGQVRGEARARSTSPSCTRPSPIRSSSCAGAGAGGDTAINPSGGALAANVVMAAGLQRMGEAASRITRGEADRAVAHATSGPCLRQNLVCVLEGD